MRPKREIGGLKLNLGCGFDKRDGWLNVDSFPECAPDQLLDIEQTPWDLPTDAARFVPHMIAA